MIRRNDVLHISFRIGWDSLTQALARIVQLGRGHRDRAGLSGMVVNLPPLIIPLVEIFACLDRDAEVVAVICVDAMFDVFLHPAETFGG